jgi:hypothetical protein
LFGVFHLHYEFALKWNNPARNTPAICQAPNPISAFAINVASPPPDAWSCGCRANFRGVPSQRKCHIVFFDACATSANDIGKNTTTSHPQCKSQSPVSNVDEDIGQFRSAYDWYSGGSCRSSTGPRVKLVGITGAWEKFRCRRSKGSDSALIHGSIGTDNIGKSSHAQHAADTSVNNPMFVVCDAVLGRCLLIMYLCGDAVPSNWIQWQVDTKPVQQMATVTTRTDDIDIRVHPFLFQPRPRDTSTIANQLKHGRA